MKWYSKFTASILTFFLIKKSKQKKSCQKNPAYRTKLALPGFLACRRWSKTNFKLLLIYLNTIKNERVSNICIFLKWNLVDSFNR